MDEVEAILLYLEFKARGMEPPPYVKDNIDFNVTRELDNAISCTDPSLNEKGICI